MTDAPRTITIRQHRITAAEMARDDKWTDAHRYHHDDVVQELREALEFYADRSFTGYDIDIGDYGLSMKTGDIIKDEGDIARAALAKLDASNPPRSA